MSSKCAPLKFTTLTTPYFAAILIAIFLMNVLNVSVRDMGILAVLGLVLGLFYLAVAYTSSKRKITSLKFIALILVAPIPLAIVMRFIIQMAIRYDNILLIIWAFIFTITVVCTYEILEMIKDSHGSTCQDG